MEAVGAVVFVGRDVVGCAVEVEGAVSYPASVAADCGLKVSPVCLFCYGCVCVYWHDMIADA